MEVEEELQLSEEQLIKLFKVWKTLNKMLEDRGYLIEDVTKQITYEEWKKFLRENKGSIRGLVSKQDPNHPDPEDVKRLYYQYIDAPKVAVKDINIFFEQMKGDTIDNGIIIISGQLAPQAKQKLQEINTEIQIECFSVSELVVNITEHELVPKHILLTDKEKKQLLDRYKIKEYQLPKILTTDPVARYYGLKRGDVVKIVRVSETAGRYITYRIAQ